MTFALFDALRDAMASHEQGSTSWLAIDMSIRVIEQAQVVNGRLQAEVERLTEALETIEWNDNSTASEIARRALGIPKPEEQT